MRLMSIFRHRRQTSRIRLGSVHTQPNDGEDIRAGGPGRPPIQEPPNQPKPPPVEEPDNSPAKPPSPDLPPVGDPTSEPTPPVEEPPPKSPTGTA